MKEKRTIKQIDQEIAKLKLEKVELIAKFKRQAIKEKKIIADWQKGLKLKVVNSKYSYQSLAIKLGISKQSISRFCNIIKPIPLKRALKLSIILNYPIHIQDEEYN